MKKRSLVLSLCCLMALGVGVGVTSCGNQTAETGDLTITGYNGSLEIGASVQLAVEGATEISFSSSNTDVVTVTATGLMKGIAEGTATIIAKSGNLEGTISVTVVKKATGGDNTGDDQEKLLATLTKDSCTGLVAGCGTGVYTVNEATDTVGGITFNYAAGKLIGFAASSYNPLIGGELNAFQAKKSGANFITTSTSIKATKIIINHIMETKYATEPSALSIAVGGVSAVVTFGTAVDAGTENEKTYSTVEITYTFSSANGTISFSNDNAFVNYFNSVKIYGSINA